MRSRQGCPAFANAMRTPMPWATDATRKILASTAFIAWPIAACRSAPPLRAHSIATARKAPADSELVAKNRHEALVLAFFGLSRLPVVGIGQTWRRRLSNQARLWRRA